MENKVREIIIEKASENNLKNISVKIPKDKFTVITGVSGSGKSSLAFDTIYAEGRRLYLSSFSDYARQFLGKASKPKVDRISNLMATISIDQKNSFGSIRSTLGTMSNIYDYLRLLFARVGIAPLNFNFSITRSLFSFNSVSGACPTCKGLGVQDKIDPALLIVDESKTIREGAFAMTTPSGYIVYSQVTMDVLNDVCESEGFSVDIKWKDLSEYQKNIIFFGSKKISVLFGKHTLESRMRWSGITAKPREEGYYKGIITIMEDILRKDRNVNILRFSRTIPCAACDGSRLNNQAREILYGGKNISELSNMNLTTLKEFLLSNFPYDNQKKIAEPIISSIIIRLNLLIELGLGYLTISRSSTSLSGGESQRIRLAMQTLGNLQNILYVLDEPSIGLHPAQNRVMLENLYRLKQSGNSVVVVEHDKDFIRNSQYLIDIGPDAGENGGELLYAGETKNFLNKKHKGHTWENITGSDKLSHLSKNRKVIDLIKISGAKHHNLKNVNTTFAINCLNVVIGVSGAGKSSLVEGILARYFRQNMKNGKDVPGEFSQIIGLEKIKNIIDINQSPIGKTPRSNVATYTKMFDYIRKIFATTELAKKRNWKSSRFSFNVKGGRCESCKGAGVVEIGMHLFSNIDSICEECDGKRFTQDTLEVEINGKNIYEILELSVDEAAKFFTDSKVKRILQTLQDVGLGYIKLGQPSTTFSGGEAQRIKLATYLAKPDKNNTLYILDEPTTGLSIYDVKRLMNSLQKLVEQNNTLIIIEHNPQIVFSADYILELGPESGDAGGSVVFNGSFNQFRKSLNSIYLKSILKTENFQIPISQPIEPYIKLSEIETNNLKKISLKIPRNRLTVITGVSGSGKSSLAFDTIYAEAHIRFTENISAFARRFMKNVQHPKFGEISGLTPVIAISQGKRFKNSRSTVASISQISKNLRLLFSRLSSSNIGKEQLLARDFSKNYHAAVCTFCKGQGDMLQPDISKIITDPDKSILDGALDGTKTGKFYGDIYGQYVAILLAVGASKNIDFSKSWNRLNTDEQRIAMYGTKNEIYDVAWSFKRKQREGKHKFTTIWKGFSNYILDEFERKQQNTRGKQMLILMKSVTCKICNGHGLNDKVLSYKFLGENIAEISDKSVLELKDYLENIDVQIFSLIQRKVFEHLKQEIIKQLKVLENSGLGYLKLNRKTNTLSGGELQRLKLANHLLTGITGITFVLDEPTIGLHSKDTSNLLEILHSLVDNDNTVIVVEHDREMILNAEHIIELGKGAGKYGGELIHSGTIEDLWNNKNSETAKYLAKSKVRYIKQNLSKNGELIIFGANANNLKDINLQISYGKISAIIGVSGSGKSSLLENVIYDSIKCGRVINAKNILGLADFHKVILVDQNRLSNSSVSTIATYTKIFDKIRVLFSKTGLAKELKYRATDFSYLNKNGQCSTCKGLGKKKISMDFMGDIWLECEVCSGKRYKQNILDVEIDSKNIFQILQMDVDSGIDFFHNHKKILSDLKLLREVGLGYLQLGQTLSTLSGGETQRLKLANALLTSSSKEHNLYLLDEPSTGLHFSDIKKLLLLLEKLRNAGNTIIFVEHNEDMIANADEIFELGPVGGDLGGYLL